MYEFYNEILPEDHYKAYIQKFWILNNIQNPLYTPVKHALPNSCCTIAFISGCGAVINFGEKEIHLKAGIYLSGQITRRVSISIKPFSKAIMVQAKPWLPSLITTIPMNELVDNVVSMALVNQLILRQFSDLNLEDEQAIIPALYKVLGKYLHTGADSYFIQWVFNKLLAGASASVNIVDIATSTGYSQRRVEQKFRALIGPTAKEMQRILQLRQLVDDLSKPGDKYSLSTLAHRHGYYDQSHFIRSYQRILLETPSRFNAGEYLLPVGGHFDFLQL